MKKIEEIEIWIKNQESMINSQIEFQERMGLNDHICEAGFEDGYLDAISEVKKFFKTDKKTSKLNWIDFKKNTPELGRQVYFVFKYGVTGNITTQCVGFLMDHGEIILVVDGKRYEDLDHIAYWAELDFPVDEK